MYTVTVNGNSKSDYMVKSTLSDILNQMSQFQANFQSVRREDTDFQEGNIVKLYLNNTQIFKGIIETTKYDGNESYKCLCYDPAIRLKHRKVNDYIKDSRNPTGANSVFTDIISENLDGTGGDIIQIGTNTAYGATFAFRVENDDRLTEVNRIARALGWDWWTDQDGGGTDQINIDERRGSPTSTYTFSDGNCAILNREFDKDNIANWIKFIGSNAIEEDLRVSLFAASDVYNYLSANITDTATTVNVDSTTGFASAGKIKVGSEIITYTGKTGTSFTGCTRGVAGVVGDPDKVLYKASEHFKGMIVFEYYDGSNYYYPETTLAHAKTNSSIKLKGIREDIISRKDIMHRATLELVAAKFLYDRLTELERIKIRPYSSDCVNDITVGDNVTINNLATDLSGLRRVVSRRIIFDVRGSQELIEYEVTNQAANFLSTLDKTQTGLESLTSYFQGVTKTLTFTKTDNSKSAGKMLMRFELPSEIQDTDKILKATLTFNREKLLYDTDSATGAGTQNSSDSGHSNHAIGSYADSGHSAHGVGTYSATGGGGSSVVVATAAATTSGTFTSTSWQTIKNCLYPATHTAGTFIIAILQGYIDGGSLLEARVKVGSDILLNYAIRAPHKHRHSISWDGSHDHQGSVGTDGGHGHGQNTGYVTASNEQPTQTLCWWCPYDTSNKWVRLELKMIGVGTYYYGLTFCGSGVASHTHPLGGSSGAGTANIGGSSGAGTANITNPSHTNPITRGIYNPSEVSLTLKALVNGVQVASQAGNVGYTSAEVDVTDELKAGGIGWQYIELYPTTSKARLGAELKVVYLAQKI